MLKHRDQRPSPYIATVKQLSHLHSQVGVTVAVGRAPDGLPSAMYRQHLDGSATTALSAGPRKVMLSVATFAACFMLSNLQVTATGAHRVWEQRLTNVPV